MHVSERAWLTYDNAYIHAGECILIIVRIDLLYYHCLCIYLHLLLRVYPGEHVVLPVSPQSCLAAIVSLATSVVASLVATTSNLSFIGCNHGLVC